jgi:hypothetical protein
LLSSERRRLADAAVETYLAWRDECDALEDAYGRWIRAGESEGALAFAVYSAALEREEHASEVYARVIQRVGDLDLPEREPEAVERSARVDTHV